VATPGAVGETVDFLSLLSDDQRRRLLERSTQAVHPAGTVIFGSESPPGAFLLDRGLVRDFWSVPDGRQATVAFFHSKELIGATLIMVRAPTTYSQVVIESTLTTLDVETVRNLATTDIEVTRAVGTHLATMVRNAFRLIAVRSLGSIAERMAFDLLERACRSQLAVGRLEVRATHAALADSIGSSREVVSRTLRQLRSLGIVETTPGFVRLLDPERLAATVRAFVT
jgi:CRP-like cAMP-binding protein